MSSESDDAPEDFRIGDPEEISQKKRINEILSRREGVLDARDVARDAVTAGEIPEQRAKAYYQSRIESLVIDLWTKFDNSDIENGKEYLEGDSEDPIDTVIIPPPPELLPSDDNDMAAGEDTPDPQRVPIFGLSWFIDNDPVVEAQFTAYTWNPPGERTAVNRRLIPWTTLDKAVIRCMQFIDETGIDADIEQSEQRTKIDDELMGEVEEWRQRVRKKYSQ